MFAAVIRTAARAVTRAYDEALRPVGLRATQLSVLLAVAAEDPMSITALAKFMGMERSTLTRNLRPLEKEGLVTLGDEGWRRSNSAFRPSSLQDSLSKRDR
jgi:DNA-binding MarR family transcriptional regulator